VVEKVVRVAEVAKEVGAEVVGAEVVKTSGI
jgi:hypothetical protein